MTPYLRPVALALVLGVAFIAPGCDDDNDNNNPAAITSPSPSPTPTPTPTPTPSPSESPSTTPAPAPGQAVTFVGKITAIDSTSFSFTIAGQSVVTNPSTTYSRGGVGARFGAFSVGEVVRVHGVQQADGTVLATKISLE
jgi:Domain of unknown function (DUF5666)